ncbi:MAG: hypothetical protein AAFV95_01685 [Bacteroidota bacterium]
MRKCLCTFLMLVMSGSLFLSAQTIIWTDDFEATTPSSGTRSLSGHTSSTDGSDPAACGSSDYFFRTDCNTSSGTGMTCSGVSDVFADIQGSYAWRGEDLDGCVTDPDIINFTGIDITGRSNLVFLGLFACDDDPNEWEGLSALDGHPDRLEVQYQIDGGGYTTGIVFRSDGSADATFGDGRGVFRVDTDNDGVGDGPTAMDKTFREFSFSISGFGTTLDLRFIAFVNGSGEEFAIDNFRVGFTTPAPVELVRFEGAPQDDKVILNWSTATELYNEGFEIQRTSGEKWETIDFVEGAGNSQVSLEYSYVDEAPAKGLQYYRLRQIDTDGKFTFSDAISVDLSAGQAKMGTLYPSPNRTGLVYIDVNAPARELVTVEVYDLMGKLRHSERLSIMRGEQTVELDVSHIGTGVFNLVWLEEEGQSNQRLIIH